MMVEQGKFRQDLFYRINVIELSVPPLRNRKQDISILIDHILDKLGRQNNADRPSLSDKAAQALQNYFFPGNVRELENILERAMTLCDDNLIEEDDLQLNQQAGMESQSTMMAKTDDSLPLEDMLGHIEKEAILKALEETNQNKTAAAKLLGMTFRALRYRLKKLGLD